jgi:hypothetical protein
MGPIAEKVRGVRGERTTPVLDGALADPHVAERPARANRHTALGRSPGLELREAVFPFVGFRPFPVTEPGFSGFVARFNAPYGGASAVEFDHTSLFTRASLATPRTPTAIRRIAEPARPCQLQSRTLPSSRYFHLSPDNIINFIFLSSYLICVIYRISHLRMRGSSLIISPDRGSLIAWQECHTVQAMSPGNRERDPMKTTCCLLAVCAGASAVQAATLAPDLYRLRNHIDGRVQPPRSQARGFSLCRGIVSRRHRLVQIHRRTG